MAQIHKLVDLGLNRRKKEHELKNHVRTFKNHLETLKYKSYISHYIASDSQIKSFDENNNNFIIC